MEKVANLGYIYVKKVTKEGKRRSVIKAFKRGKPDVLSINETHMNRCGVWRYGCDDVSHIHRFTYTKHLKKKVCVSW